MAGKVVELTDETFDSAIGSAQTPVLVDFWAPWCGPCKMIAPIIEELSVQYAGKITICKVNIDDHRQAAGRFAVSAIPTIILFKDGQVVKKWVGMTSKKALSEAFDEQL